MTAWSREDARKADAADPLSAARDLFVLQAGEVYLVGHSLGPASRGALHAAENTASGDWARGKVASWNEAGWIDLPKAVGAKIAPLLGVEAEEVVVCDSVSINLFKLALAALPFVRERRIVIEEDEFPTDLYIGGAAASLSGAAVHRAKPGEGVAALAEGGILIKSAVNYRTAERADIAAAEKAAAEAGGLVVWDLSHATGVVPLALARDGAKLAAGCTYKYLNGGPGAPSFLYAEKKLASRLETPLPGWLGHAAPFSFSPDYEAAPGTERFVAGTPPILSLATLSGALDAFAGVTPEALGRKAQRLGDLVISRLDEIGLAVTSPREAARRGGHVSFLHEDGYAVTRALADRGIKCDFRTPSTIRFGLSPLFLGYEEVFGVMDVVEEIVTQRLYDREDYRRRAKVT